MDTESLGGLPYARRCQSEKKKKKFKAYCSGSGLRYSLTLFCDGMTLRPCLRSTGPSHSLDEPGDDTPVSAGNGKAECHPGTHHTQSEVCWACFLSDLGYFVQ